MSKFVPDGYELKRIRYESSGGSMNYHSEFEIEADADEIIRTSYWGDYYFCDEEQAALEKQPPEIDISCVTRNKSDEILVREHIPADKSLWTALAEETEYLKEHLEPVRETKNIIKPLIQMHVLDGGDYSRLYITWDTADGEKTVQYYTPAGKRWSSVLQILHEMARPVGRDLRRIGETVMTDMFLKTPGYSYQISPVNGGNGYYFYVYGDSSDINRLSLSQWEPVREYLSGLDVSGFGKGRYEDKYFLRLSFNDGINKYLEVNKKLAEQIRGFIRKSIFGE